VWERLGIFAAPNGHGFMGDYHSDDRLVVAMANPIFADYRQRLSARVGAERATEILSTHRFNSIVYPNCSFMSQFRQYRIVQPVAVDRTIVCTYSFRLKGAPEEMFRDTVAFANIVNGTASEVLTDDLEVYERAQQGLSSQRVDWVYLGRGAGRDVVDGPYQRGGTGTSELPMRNQFAAWSRYMTEAR
jgi:phenylpropionate dioxygenase-like ring-hydroxylating dioxygenase large terminal subunit